MARTEKRTVSLKEENVAFIDAKVRSGGYASTSEVVRAGLRTLQERDEAVERWLREEVAQTYDAVAEGRTKTRPLGEALDQIRAHHAKRMGSK